MALNNLSPRAFHGGPRDDPDLRRYHHILAAAGAVKERSATTKPSSKWMAIKNVFADATSGWMDRYLGRIVVRHCAINLFVHQGDAPFEMLRRPDERLDLVSRQVAYQTVMPDQDFI